jgi:hypothetical protein
MTIKKSIILGMLAGAVILATGLDVPLFESETAQRAQLELARVIFDRTPVEKQQGMPAICQVNACSLLGQHD